MVAILDADKEGFSAFRDVSLIQTIGRAARNLSRRWRVLYADTMTDSMKRAIDETERRRAKQLAYNEQHHMAPAGIMKEGSGI